MRTFNPRRMYLPVLAALSATLLGACYGSFCEEFPDNCHLDGAGGSTSSTSSTSTSSGMTDTSSSTGTSPDCIPTDLTGPKGDECGVFVDPGGGNDANPGTLAAPKKSFANGLAALTAGKILYLCEGTVPDMAGPILPAGTQVIGGLDCGDFKKKQGARTTIAPDQGQIGMRFADGAGKTEVRGLSIAVTADILPGSSAIGIIIGDVEADLQEVDVVAGDAMPGQSSSTPMDDIGSTNAEDASVKGKGGNPADTMTVGVANPGGIATTNPKCSSTSGSGGDGGKVQGTAQNASAGGTGVATPLPTMGAADGLGGAGDSGAGCLDGHQGRNGDATSDGAGANGPSSLGSISSDGYHGASGSQGPDGNPGQGGGGGGGAKGDDLPTATRGASGGAGGAGGCGGKGALGGGPGGSSIGILVLGPTAPTLLALKISVGNGGDGGTGAAGQFGVTGGNGGTGGSGVNGTFAACNGGKGGQGSNGGAGGGGRGGHSVGIAYVSAQPADGFTVTRKSAGAAGPTAGAGTPADPGVSVDVQVFPGS